MIHKLERPSSEFSINKNNVLPPHPHALDWHACAASVCIMISPYLVDIEQKNTPRRSKNMSAWERLEILSLTAQHNLAASSPHLQPKLSNPNPKPILSHYIQKRETLTKTNQQKNTMHGMMGCRSWAADPKGHQALGCMECCFCSLPLMLLAFSHLWCEHMGMCRVALRSF